MNRFIFIVLAASLGGCFAAVDREGQVVGGEAGFSLSLPVLLPPLVVVEPGVSVVRDLDDEVFYSDGYYWARQDRAWYRSQDHRGRWSRVEERYVPQPIARSPPGRYRRYHGEERGEWRRDRD